MTQGGTFGLLQSLNVKTSLIYFTYTSVLVAAGLAARGLWKWRRKKQRRRARRFDTNLAITFATGAINYNGRLCDISRVGGRINHLGAIPSTTRAAIKLFVANNWYEGRIVWANEDFCGIQFDQLLTREEVAQITRSERYPNKAAPEQPTAPVTEPLTTSSN